jgi:hypothetical protein
MTMFELHPSLTRLFRLSTETLGLGRNYFIGTLPSQIGALTRLSKYPQGIEGRHAYDNHRMLLLTLFSATKVTVGFEGNSISSEIPTVLGNLRNLGEPTVRSYLYACVTSTVALS